MKNAIRRWAAWILVGALLFNLAPMNPTHAGEKEMVGEQGISMEETVSSDQDITEDGAVGSDQNITTEESVAGDTEGSDSSSEASTEDKVTDNTEENTNEDVSSSQENPTENADQDMLGTTEKDITENTTAEEAVEAITTEKSTEIQDTTEGQTNSEYDGFNENGVFSTDDELMILDAEESLAKEHELVGTISKVTIDDEWVTTGDMTEVQKGSKVEIRLNYKIKNSDNVKVNEPCYFDLNLKGVTLIVNGNMGIFDSNDKKVGEWNFENGKLVCWFTDEEFLKKSNVSGKIDLEGEIDLSDIQIDDKGYGKIQIGNDTYDVHVNLEELGPEVTVKKTVGSFEYSGGLPKAIYTIEITALKDTDNVEFWDQVGGGDGSDQGYIGIDNAPNTITISRKDINPGTWNWQRNSNGFFYKKFSGKIPHMDKGETITITYTCYMNPNIYRNNYTPERVNNKITLTDWLGHEVSDEASFPDYALTVTKTGNYEDGMVEWMITIENPGGMDLAISNVHIEDYSTGYKELELYKEDSKNGYITIQGANGKDIKTGYPISEFMERGFYFSELSGYLSNGNSISSRETKYVIKYTLEVKETYTDKSNVRTTITDENRVTITDNANLNVVPEKPAVVGIGPTTPLLEKKGTRVTGENKIEWMLTFKVPKGGLENPIIHDNYDSTMTFDDNVKIVKVDSRGTTLQTLDNFATSPANPEYPNDSNYDAAGKSAFKIAFTGTLQEGTYRITYTTTYDTKENKTYKNEAYVIVDNEPGDLAPASVTINVGLSKSHIGGTNTYGTTEQTWRLQIRNFDTLKADGYRIEDTWTSEHEYEYVPDSMRAHKGTSGTSGYDGTDAYPMGDEYINTISNGISFDVTDVIKHARAQGWTNLYITYKTRIKDQNGFLNSYVDGEVLTKQPTDYSVENKAQLYENNSPIGNNPSVKANPRPRAVIDKVGNYDKYTAPYAEYAISVNPGGNDLVAGDTLVVTDTMPTGFELVEGSVEVYQAAIGSAEFTNDAKPGAPLTQGEWTFAYDEDKNILTITIPDQTEVIIKYKVIINESVGPVLNEENSVNAVDLGISGVDSSTDSCSILGYVQESRAVAESTTAELTISKSDKSDENKKLAGAEFQIRMVDYDSTTGNITDPAVNTPQGYVEPAPLATDGKGNCTVNNLYFDHLYKVVETKAPEGYVLDDTPRYFVIVGHDNESGKEEAQKLYPNGTIVYYIEDSRIMSIGNEKEETPTTEIDKTTEATTETTTTTTTETTTEITTEEKTTEERTTEEKTTEEKTTETKTTTSTSSKTGDNSPIGALAGLMVFGTTTVVLIKKRKKKLINN